MGEGVMNYHLLTPPQLTEECTLPATLTAATEYSPASLTEAPLMVSTYQSGSRKDGCRDVEGVGYL